MIEKIRNYLRGISLLNSILNGIQVCVYLIGIALVLWIASKIGTSIGNQTWPPDIQKINSWAQIVIAYAAVFAIGQYAVAYADIADRKTKHVLEFVKLFRETVLEKGDQIRIYTKKNKITVPFFLLRKNTPFLQFTPDEFFGKIVPHQKKLIEDYSQLLEENIELESMIISCLNSAEEFSIGILNSKAQQHPAVSSIKKPFIEIIERLAVPLHYQVGMMDDQFTYLSSLYRLWKTDVGYLPFTQEDRVDKYEERLAQFRNE